MRLLIPQGVCPDLVLPPGVEIVRVDPTRGLPDSVADADALVAWAVKPAWLAEAARRLERVRWVQSLGVGAEQVLRAGFAPDVVITNGAGLHDLPVAEHALALLLAAARRLDLLMTAQQQHEWSDRGGAQPGFEVPGFTTLHGRRVVIWGFGGIGRKLAQYVAALGGSPIGIARTSGERSGFPVVAVDDADSVLPAADALVLTLPGGSGTRHVLDARRLALLGSRCWVVNVGRGSCIDEDALVGALRRGSIAGAALDVFETEPLPADSPIWDAPNLIVTPHAAGGRPFGAEQLIQHNVNALLGQVPWRNRVEHPIQRPVDPEVG